MKTDTKYTQSEVVLAAGEATAFFFRQAKSRPSANCRNASDWVDWYGEIETLEELEEMAPVLMQQVNEIGFQDADDDGREWDDLTAEQFMRAVYARI